MHLYKRAGMQLLWLWA